MSKDYGLSPQDLNIIKIQASRRAEMRKEFLKQRTNPFKHAAEAGYVCISWTRIGGSTYPFWNIGLSLCYDSCIGPTFCTKFDSAVQKFMSMKVSQYEYFQPNPRNSLFGVCAIVLPMFALGYIIWKDRTTREAQIRSGELRYRERMFKFA